MYTVCVFFTNFSRIETENGPRSKLRGGVCQKKCKRLRESKCSMEMCDSRKAKKNTGEKITETHTRAHTQEMPFGPSVSVVCTLSIM